MRYGCRTRLLLSIQNLHRLSRFFTLHYNATIFHRQVGMVWCLGKMTTCKYVNFQIRRLRTDNVNARSCKQVIDTLLFVRDIADGECSRN